jgi:hypothetical protein
MGVDKMEQKKLFELVLDLYDNTKNRRVKFPKGDFKMATGTYEIPYANEEPTKVGYGQMMDAGLYCINNNTIAFVYVEHSKKRQEKLDYPIWCGRASLENIELLEAAGFREGSFYVPHSNDGGQVINMYFGRELPSY